MNPDEPVNPPNAPEPETNPVPPPSPQPESASEPPVQQNQAAAPEPAAPQAPGNEVPSAFKLFKPSWEALKLNLGTFVVLGIIPFVLSSLTLFGIAGSISALSHKGTGVLAAAFLVVALIYLVFTPAITYTQVQSSQGLKVGVSEAVKAALGAFWRFWGVMILVGLLVIGGFILLIVPGIFMIRRYFLASYVVFTENLGVMDTLKRSAAVSKPHAGAIWGVIGVAVLISLVGIVPIVGWIASIVGSVMYYCAPAVRWEQLRKLGPAPVET